MKEIYLRVEEKFINFHTGEVVDFLSAKSGIIVEYTDAVIHLKRPKKPSTKYLYKSKKENVYYGSPSLTTTFLMSVLYNYLDTKAVAVVSNSVVIAFFGGNQEYVVIQDKDEGDKFLEKVFQGIHYKTIGIEDAVKLVIPDNKKLLILAGSTLTVALTLFTYLFFSSDDETNVKTTPTNQVNPAVIDPDVVSVNKTYQLISTLYNLGLKPYQYVDKIDFSVGEIHLKSAVPLKDYTRDGKWYSYKMGVTSSAEFKPLKSYNFCYEKVRDFEGSLLKEFNDKKVVFEIDKDNVPTEKVEEFLRNVYGCKISLSGVINQNQPLVSTVHLKAELFYK